MNLFHKLPVRRKLMLMMFVSNVIILMIVFSVTLYQDTAAIKRNTIEFSQSQVKSLNQDFIKILVFDSPHIAADVVTRLKATHSIQNVFLYDKSGEPIFSFSRDPALSIEPPLPEKIGYRFVGDYLHIFDSVVYEGGEYGSLYYRISTRLLNEKVQKNINSAILLFLIVVAISLLLSGWFQRIFSQPIISLAQSLKNVAEDKDFSLKISTREENEVGQLYANFNLMLEEINSYSLELSGKNTELERHKHNLEEMVQDRTKELKNYTDELESFSYSVSHDLRAPLSTINGFCAVILEDCIEQLDEHGKDSFLRIQRASLRMSDLIDDLLMLSEITRREVVKEEIDFSAVCDDVISSADFKHQGHSPIILVTPNMKLHADSALIKI